MKTLSIKCFMEKYGLEDETTKGTDSTGIIKI